MDFKLAPKILVVALTAGSFAMSAIAQWQWLDKDGRKVFSDRAPPAEIQEAQILKRPGSHFRQVVQPAADSAATGASAARLSGTASAVTPKASAPKLSGKDAELEAKKKKAEDEEAAKKKVEDEKVAKAKADNCDRAKSGLATLQSGVRMSSTNAKGEREVFDDAKRATETRRTQDIVESNCN